LSCFGLHAEAAVSVSCGHEGVCLTSVCGRHQVARAETNSADVFGTVSFFQVITLMRAPCFAPSKVAPSQARGTTSTRTV
jgi:hypothetical protein